MLPKWERLCTPTYVHVGEDDAVADTANYSFAKKHITNCAAVFMKLKKTGHQITQQQPELIKELLLEKSHCENDSYYASKETEMSLHANHSEPVQKNVSLKN